MDGAKEQEERKNKKRPHVLVIPHCTQGHIIPAVLLSKKLVKESIRVTLIGHQPEIDRLISNEDPELNAMELLQFVGLPRPDVVTQGSFEEAHLLEKSFNGANMLEQLSVSDGPTFILSDMFNTWSTDLAMQLQIPVYQFVTSGAVLISFFQGCEDLIIQGTVRVNADDSQVEKFDGQVNLPGLCPLRYDELIVSFRRIPLLFNQFCRDFMRASGILINTFYELEAPVIDALRNQSKIRGQKFYPIGPLLRAPDSLSKATVVQGLNSNSKEQCIRWLNSQPDSSVLYISFGTLFQLKPLQIKELALGLERSKHRFLWVLLHYNVSPLHNAREMDPEKATYELMPGSDVLPPGFEERIAERGYIMKDWTPQVQVLSHPSIGGFLTHCGWNSCLEAVRSSVTMLAWPVSADQHLNCRYLVDVLKVASEVKQAPNGIVEQDEVEKVVRLFMEEERMAMRGRMDVLKLQAAAALGVGGSSTYALQQVVQDIKNA